MCINVECGGDIGVPQNLFHNLRRKAGSHHLGGGGVPASVWLHALDAQFLHQAAKGLAHIVVIPRDAILGRDQKVSIVPIQPLSNKWLDIRM